VLELLGIFLYLKLLLIFYLSEVLKAKHSNNGKVVALKKIFTKSEQEGFPITSLREIKLLKNVSHQNVASLIDMAVSYKTVGNDFKEVDDIYMVFPFMDHDLTGILENQNISLSLPQIKCYMKQLLEGLSYLHQVKMILL
jgi:serine/threonine-protein kinase BUR1